jgi:5-methylcytosine-specific restriction endonuclease McrA
MNLKPLKAGINPYYDKEYYQLKPRLSVINQYRYKIYKLHNFKCYVCKELLNHKEQVDLHHLKPRSDGGDYSLDNIVPVHKTCHETITNAGKFKQ